VFKLISSEPLSEPLKKVLSIIKSEKKVNRKTIMKKLGLPRATATRHLSKLKEIGLIDFVGSSKIGYYTTPSKKKKEVQNE